QCMSATDTPNIMKKFIKWLAIILGVLLVAFAIAYLIFNEPLPTGKKGPEADALARKMLMAVDKDGWDTTTVVQWSFMGLHDYLWDKDRNLVQITWSDKKVLLDPDEISGKAWENGVEQSEEDAAATVRTAWNYWCNDSFWFNAVVKCFDPGTSRSIVTMEDGSEALLVSYDSGGVTPGDSYLWILDENGLPKSWKMWVKIIPIGGVEFSWEQWKTLPTGAKVASLHDGAVFDLEISEIKGAHSLEAFGLTADPFAPIAE
ncbi:MAG: hypothetical protein AAFO94_06940, partial [Bacteroidota bacterium]